MVEQAGLELGPPQSVLTGKSCANLIRNSARNKSSNDAENILANDSPQFPFALPRAGVLEQCLVFFAPDYAGR